MVVGVDVLLKIIEREYDRRDVRLKPPGFNISGNRVVGVAVDWFEFPDVAGIEEHHEIRR